MSQEERQNARTDMLENVAEIVGRAASGRAERDAIRAELGLPTSVQVRGTVVDAVAKAAGYKKKRRKPKKPQEPPDVYAPPTGAAGAGAGLAAAALALLVLFVGGKKR